MLKTKFSTAGLEGIYDGDLNECKDRSSAVNTFNKFKSVLFMGDDVALVDACPMSCQLNNFQVKIRKFHINSWIDFDGQTGTFYIKAH